MIADLTYKQLGERFEVAGYIIGYKYYPPIAKRDAGYQIRIATAEIRRSRSSRSFYDYFELDSTGLILKSPRGQSKFYTKKIRIPDIAEAYTSQANEEVEA